MERKLAEFDQRGLDPDVVSELNKRGIVVSINKSGFVPFDPFVPPNVNQLMEFPLDTLPPTIQEYTKAVAESLQVSIDMVAVTILGITALCIQGEFKVQPKADWQEPLNLYILIVARPSERKTPVMKEVARPVYNYVNTINEKKQSEICEYSIKRDVLSKKVAHLKESVVKNKKGVSMQDILDTQKELEELEEVLPLRIIVDDITTEALVRVMKENDERISIVTAEGGIFGMLAGRYNNQPNIDIVLKAYSGEPYTSDRIGRKGESLSNPLLTLLIMTQPVVVDEAMQNKEFRERGLLARFLYSLPASRIGNRKYNSQPINPEIRKSYDNLINELLSIRDWKFEQREIKFSSEADTLSEEFANEIERKLLDDFEKIEDWAGKFHGQVMRIAGILHCIKYIVKSPTTKLEGQTMKEAIKVGRYFLNHAIASFRIAGLADPKETKDAKYILKRIDKRDKRDKSITKRELFRLCDGRFKKVEDMQPGLDELVKHGYIRIYKNNTTGGRPTEVIEMNPEYEGQKEGVKLNGTI
ncbi:YfjI family protein [Anaerocolumna sp.]|uniref:YfjI family protein n=1 Tax=Anaerocolumna sp. TaxID=2041569 RepID=UPI0028A792A7|nr:YfjI family protein [Anaerocolumna sp.]